MTDPTRLAADQLARMRGMNRYYHERFFSDVRFTTAAVATLFVVGFWQVRQAFLLIPVLALIGAVQTAFDASYLIFSRHYAEALERRLNDSAGEYVLIAHRMENDYLFPLNEPKIVTASLGKGFSWFGFMTLFYTVVGVVAFGFGLALGWESLTDAGTAWTTAYLATLGATVAWSLATGWWWFVKGTGEARLQRVIGDHFAR